MFLDPNKLWHHNLFRAYIGLEIRTNFTVVHKYNITVHAVCLWVQHLWFSFPSHPSCFSSLSQQVQDGVKSDCSWASDLFCSHAAALFRLWWVLSLFPLHILVSSLPWLDVKVMSAHSCSWWYRQKKWKNWIGIQNKCFTRQNKHILH